MKRLTVGSGDRPALLVHGNDLCAEFYRSLAEAMAERGFTTTLITLPGFHHEPALEEPGWHALVSELLGALPGPQTTLIGHSMGGLMALLAAARQPPEVARLVLLEPAIFPTRTVAKLAAQRYLDTVVRGQRQHFVNWNGGMHRIHDPARFPAEAIELYLDVRERSDRATGDTLFRTLPDLYPLPYDRVTVPTLLVAGSTTGWRAALMGRITARRLGARRCVVANAAHWLANEQDAAVAAHIEAFVAEGPIRIG